VQPWPIVAVEVDIGPLLMEEAIALGRQPEGTRAAFHSRYVFQATGDPSVDRFEVISELRRLVLALEERRARGDTRAFGLADARAALQPWRGRLSLVARLRFHPLNTLVSVPDYGLRLRAPGEPSSIRPLDIRRTPLYGTPAGPLALPPAPGAFLAGCDVEGVFDAAVVGNRTRTVMLVLGQKELARGVINFGAID
jgi:hypothetical protein